MFSLTILGNTERKEKSGHDEVNVWHIEFEGYLRGSVHHRSGVANIN